MLKLNIIDTLLNCSIVTLMNHSGLRFSKNFKYESNSINISIDFGVFTKILKDV